MLYSFNIKTINPHHPQVFTCGDMPYGRAKNPEVVERVQRGQILQKPSACPYEVYEVSCIAIFPLISYY